MTESKVYAFKRPVGTSKKRLSLVANARDTLQGIGFDKGQEVDIATGGQFSVIDALEAAFPAAKFSVTTERTGSINVEWADGPTNNDVQDVTEQFAATILHERLYSPAAGAWAAEEIAVTYWPFPDDGGVAYRNAVRYQLARHTF